MNKQDVKPEAGKLGWYAAVMLLCVLGIGQAFQSFTLKREIYEMKREVCVPKSTVSFCEKK